MNIVKSVINAVGVEIESPLYEVKKKIDQDTEIRKYTATKWVGVKLKDKAASEDNSKKMFFTLFDYISGKNDQDKKISMTSPVCFSFINFDRN